MQYVFILLKNKTTYYNTISKINYFNSNVKKHNLIILIYLAKYADRFSYTMILYYYYR